MIPIHLYFYAYLAICIILVLQYVIRTSDYPKSVLTKEDTNQNYIKVCMIGVFFIIFFGFREYEDDPLNYMADTSGYAQLYEWVKFGTRDAYDTLYDYRGHLNFDEELLFVWIRDEMATMGWSVEAWFIVVASIFIIPILIVIKRWFPNSTYLAMLFIITSFGFYGGGINGIRSADASSLVILGISYIITQQKNVKDYVIGILLCAAGYFTHHSVIIIILALVASFFIVRSTKIAIGVWIFAIIMSLTMGNALANYGVMFFDDDRGLKYLAGGGDDEIMAVFAHTGFRWDFLLYSAMPILLGWYVLITKGIKDTTYKLLVNTYILANAVWIVFMYASYTNRFASLSWSMYSYILLYPLIRYNIWGEKQATYTALILIGQIIFVILF